MKFNEDTLSKGGHGNVHGLKKGKKWEKNVVFCWFIMIKFKVSVLTNSL